MSDKDLVSVQQARDLVEAAHRAQAELVRFDQAKIDRICEAMARAALRESARLGALAVEETGYGVPADKQEKNRFAAEDVWNYFRGLRTVGVVSESKDVVEIASPRGVVAGIIPLATGTAYAAKALKNGRITVCLFGDGALEEGAAPEALNLASLWKLPVLFLCENNGKYGTGRATGATQSSSMAAYPLTDLPKAYKVPAQQIDGLDSGMVHTTISQAVEKIRRGEGPQFIEAQTVRWPGSETNWPSVAQPTDSSLAWDVSGVTEKVRDWYRSCDPLLIFMRELVDGKQATKEEIARMIKDLESQMKAAARLLEFEKAAAIRDQIVELRRMEIEAQV